MLLTFFIYDKHKVTSEGRVCVGGRGGRWRNGCRGAGGLEEEVRNRGIGRLGEQMR